MRVAIVHDWLTGMRGGEKCLEVFCEIYPEADIFALFHQPGSVSGAIESHRIYTSPLQRIPGARRRYRYTLPLMPTAVRMFPLEDYDFILSSSHCVAKGAKGGYRTYHLSYCHTPMRYAWSGYEAYFACLGGAVRWFFPLLVEYLRRWDNEANKGVHDFIANSYTVAERIRRYYARQAEVLYPPVDTEFYLPRNKRVSDYYLMVTAFAPYKRVDAAIEAFGRLGRPLKVVGEGQDFDSIRALGKSNVEFLGWQDDETIRELYSGCRAFILPGEEDFGITPLEAHACGRPVLALGAGGALETVVGVNAQEYEPPPGFIPWNEETAPTGLFFSSPEPASIEEAVLAFEKMEGRFSPEAARKQAERFARENFKKAAAERFRQGWLNHRERLEKSGETY
ncbi:MAG: glycosyltransferase [Nitrospinae bacterium]|nr:glycosyltransferase [Nitrospinota bacterium]